MASNGCFIMTATSIGSILQQETGRETLSARYRQPPTGLFYRYKSSGTHRKPDAVVNLLEVVRPGPHIRRLNTEIRAKRRRKTSENVSLASIGEGLKVLRQLNGSENRERLGRTKTGK